MAAILLLFTTSCNQSPPQPTQAFYHWQTELKVDRQLLDDHRADRLYIKAFDISWEGRPEPSALLIVNDSLPVEAVPVVFITNEVFQHPTEGLTEDLVDLLAEVFPFPHSELQIDCDWTAGTRVQYFSFLQQLAKSSGKQISVTVRLHQYRDREAQGIPPVDRAVLMAYNTGDLGSWETENSIVDSNIIAAYVDGQPPYPLPLDLALAVYDWAAVYRRDELAYLINEPNLTELADTARFTPLGPTRFSVKRSTYYAGLYLYEGDLIRRETATPQAAARLALSLWPEVAGRDSKRIIYYRMGSRQWAD